MQTLSSPHHLHQIGILGMGLSGSAVLERAQSLGIKTVCWDDRQAEDSFISPEYWPWHELDAVIISPGIPHLHPAPHPAAQMARDNNVELISEIEFALRTGHGRDGKGPSAQFVVVTGTNGKSTTTALLGHLMDVAGYPHAVGGNIGKPLSSLPVLPEGGVYLIEMSSYQLETTPSLNSDISILLNITPDHLDRHGGMTGYIHAKARALSAVREDGLIITGDDDLCADARTHAARTGDNAGTAAQIVITDALLAEEMSRGAQMQNPALQGTHNTQNCVAVRMAGLRLGISEDVIDRAISDFSGLAHRMQPVGEMGGIRFINDSKATNGEAAARALDSFTNIYWCAGGLAKEDGITACLPYLDNVRRAYFYGRSGADFAKAAQNQLPCSVHHTLDDAVGKALADASEASGTQNIILLSPAAASFDQFTSFEARGRHFCHLAQTFIQAQAEKSGGIAC